MRILFILIFIILGLRLCFAFLFGGGLFLARGVSFRILGRVMRRTLFLISISVILVLGSFGIGCGRYPLMTAVS